RERNEDLLRCRLHDVVHRRSVVDRRLHIEEGDLVRALLEVAAGQFNGIAGIAEVEKVDALDDAPGRDIQAGNDPHRDAHGYSLAAWIGLTRIARAPRS